MSHKHSIMKIDRLRTYSFPAKVFGYLTLCSRVKATNEDKPPVEECPNNLPFVSEITRRFTPQGLVHARLCFLKYK